MIQEAAKHYYLLYSIDAHSVPIKDILIIEESGHLVSCAEDGKILVWNYPTSTIVKSFEKKNEKFLCLAYSYQMKQLYTGTASNNILAFPIEDVLGMKVSMVDENADTKTSPHQDFNLQSIKGYGSNSFVKEEDDEGEDHLEKQDGFDSDHSDEEKY